MNLLAATFNIILFILTCLQIVNNGVSSIPIYILLTLFLLLVPVLNLVMILSGARNNSWYSFHIKKKDTKNTHKEIPYMDTFIKAMVLTFNLILFAVSCWAFVDQYPHPKGDGVVFFTIVVLLTPVISLLTISRNRENIGHFA